MLYTSRGRCCLAAQNVLNQSFSQIAEEVDWLYEETERPQIQADINTL